MNWTNIDFRAGISSKPTQNLALVHLWLIIKTKLITTSCSGKVYWALRDRDTPSVGSSSHPSRRTALAWWRPTISRTRRLQIFRHKYIFLRTLTTEIVCWIQMVCLLLYACRQWNLLDFTLTTSNLSSGILPPFNLPNFHSYEQSLSWNLSAQISEWISLKTKFAAKIKQRVVRMKKDARVMHYGFSVFICWHHSCLG